jgi:hypothetical protein
VSDTTPPPAPRRSPVAPRPLVAILVIAAIAITVLVASRPEPAPTRTTSTVEEGGLEWGDVDVTIVDDAGAVDASVTMDGEAFPEADSRDDRFVMFQLGDGRYDTDAHVDDSEAERVIGLDDDDTIQLRATRAAQGAVLPAGTGRYAMSVDGSVAYRDIPAGTYELRAIVVDRTGAWHGELAQRTVRVR